MKPTNEHPFLVFTAVKFHFRVHQLTDFPLTLSPPKILGTSSQQPFKVVQSVSGIRSKDLRQMCDS